MAEPNTLELERISLSFGGLQVLQALNMNISAGELLALIGPNGAGKTSVLNCISGIYRPNDGRIRFEGRELTGLRPHLVARAGIARTFQHAEVFDHMSVLENLLVGRHTNLRTNIFTEGIFFGSARRQEAEQRHVVEEVIEFVELERHRNTPVGTLPHGLQKLVGFARALAMEPRLLLLDEPSAGLNREEKEDLARFILRIRHELRIAMIWVEHDMQMVADLADRICVLNYGEYVTDGPPGEVLADGRVVEAYLGGHRAYA